MIRVSRVGAVHGAFVLFAIALVGRSAWVQLGQTERWRTRAAAQQVAPAELPAPRGAILDAAGRVLVESRSLVRLDVAPTEVKRPAALRDALKTLGVPAEFVARATDRRRKWVELPGRYLTTDAEAAMGMRGVHPRPVMERVAPPTDGLRRLLGTTDRDGQAVGGLEAALDSVLRGVPGQTQYVKDARGRRLASPELAMTRPVPGHTTVLTLHQGLQDIAERALSEAIAENGASGGDIVVLDPHSGEVRALASRRAQVDASGATALTEPYEPGSTLKPFLAAALLERGRVRLDERVNTYNGTWKTKERTISDVHRAPHLSFAEVIQFSSNIGMVQFAGRLSVAEEYETLRDAGFGMATGVPYPSESNGRLRAPREWSGTSAASLAMGYEISVTPLQLAAAYGAIANGGELLEPQLVREVRAPDGTVTWRSSRRVVRRLMREETARTVRSLLRDVVAAGTATTADLASFELAGKSGTARRVRRDGRGYEEGKYTASFVGLFPAEAPQIVILVKLDDPQGAYYGGRIAAPATKAVLEAAIAARDGSLDRRALAAVPQRITAAQVAVPDSVRSAQTAARAAESSRTSVVFELATPASPRPRRKAPVVVPDVRGLSVRTAVRAIHRAGLRVALTKASEGALTIPVAGTLVAPGAVVRLAPQR